MERATATRARTIQKINDYVIYMVFLLAIGITFYAYSATLHNAKKRHAAEFHLRSEEISSNIHKEIKVYEQVLWSSVAFFNSSEIIRRDEWKEFIDTININKHWPGIQALGYVIALLPSELHAHEETMHKEGFIDYKVQPQTPRDFYTSIIFIEPFDWRNQRAFGYDMWSSPQRQRAMQLAMTTGDAYATNVITLMQETQNEPQKGFSIFAPIYNKTEPPSKTPNIQPLEKQFKGWVFAPFRINDFMAPIIEKTALPIYINITDTTDNQSTPLYEQSITEFTDSLDTYETRINVLGREWKIQTLTPALSFKYLLFKENLSLLITSFCIDFILLFFLIKLRTARKNMHKNINAHCDNILNEKNQALIIGAQLQQENEALTQQIALLQEWLQEREFRIKELKLENRSNDL